MKAVTGWNRKIFQTPGQINIFKLAHRAPQDICGKTPRLSGYIQLLRKSIRRRLYHGLIVTCNVMRVNSFIHSPGAEVVLGEVAVRSVRGRGGDIGFGQRRVSS